VLDWADTFAYVFWLVFGAVMGVMLLVHGWDLTNNLSFLPP